MKDNWIKYRNLRNIFYGVGLSAVVAGFILIPSSVSKMASLENSPEKIHTNESKSRGDIGVISYYLGVGSFIFGLVQNSKKKDLEKTVRGL